MECSVNLHRPDSLRAKIWDIFGMAWFVLCHRLGVHTYYHLCWVTSEIKDSRQCAVHRASVVCLAPWLDPAHYPYLVKLLAEESEGPLVGDPVILSITKL